MKSDLFSVGYKGFSDLASANLLTSQLTPLPQSLAISSMLQGSILKSLRSEWAREPLTCSHSPCGSRGPNKALPEFLVWPLVNFYWSGKAETPGRYQIYDAQGGAVVPFRGEDPGTHGTTERSFPVGDKRPPEPLVSESLRLASLTSRSLGASVPSFRQCFPLPLVLFPLLISLYFSFLCPLLLPSYPSERGDVGQLQHHSCQLVRPAPSGRQRLTLTGDRQRWERLVSHRADLGPAASPWWEIYESDRGLNLI